MVQEAIKRVTINLPAGLLKEAEETTGKGITETILEGLQLIKQRRAYMKAIKMRGKLNLSIDIETSRERNCR
jgi:hypothetical protein